MTSILTPEEVERIAETLPKPDTGLAECHPSWGLGYRKDADGKYTIPVPPGNVHPFAASLESAILAKLAAREMLSLHGIDEATLGEWRQLKLKPDELLVRVADLPQIAASLAARVEVLERALPQVMASLAWLAFGECRGWVEGPIPSASQAEAIARAALFPAATSASSGA